MENINLRRLQLDDAKQIAHLINNKKIWDNLRNYIPHPYHEEDAIFFINLTLKETPEQTFGIKYKGQLCGVIGLIIQNDVYENTAELGYWIGEEFWKKGIATKAVALINDYGFQQLNLRRIYAGIFEFNSASIKVLEKNGYQQEGIFRQSVTKNGQIYDEYRYAKLKNTI